MSDLLKILKKTNLEKDDIIYLLNENDIEKRDVIQKYFENICLRVPKNYHNSEVKIDISNYCNADCLFCKSRNGNGKITRFRLNREEIIKKAIDLHKSGCNSILLHSGYDDFYNTDRIAYIIYSIKQIAKLKITLSFGLRELAEYKEWKIAGADSYYLNLITRNRNLYSETHSWNSFENRVKHVTELKNLGYNVGSGSIIGLPNQTCNDLAEDILFLQDVNPHYIDFCHFNCVKSVHDNIESDEFIKRGIEIAQIANLDTRVRLNNLIN